MNLPASVEFIISRLEKFGHRADIVGGCVRDSLLLKQPNDYDITTDATPDEIKHVFSDIQTVETGIKHGTLTVIVDSIPYEVTTYRLDGEYSDNRHPDSVSFTKRLSDDLARRDFTVNAMCYNHRDGFTDLLSGRADIAARVIRAVGEPVIRFEEDALRILRALRFASTLDFTIEANTALAIKSKAHLLKNVSAERIYSEWKKLICGVGAHRILSEYMSVAEIVIPELSVAKLPDADLFAEADGDVRELSLFVGHSGSERFAEAMKRLKCDNKHKNYGMLVLKNIAQPFDSTIDIKRLLAKVGTDATYGIIKLRMLLGTSNFDDYKRLSDLILSGVCYTVSDMRINGNDLKEIGLSGKRIGEVLDLLLNMVIEEKIENEREALLSAVAKHSN